MLIHWENVWKDVQRENGDHRCGTNTTALTHSPVGSHPFCRETTGEKAHKDTIVAIKVVMLAITGKERKVRNESSFTHHTTRNNAEREDILPETSTGRMMVLLLVSCEVKQTSRVTGSEGAKHVRCRKGREATRVQFQERDDVSTILSARPTDACIPSNNHQTRSARPTSKPLWPPFIRQQ